jgi:membrane-associated protease RseP (regulator of RpoE activity)
MFLSFVPAALAGDAEAPKRVPFEMLISNHMVVEAKLNGKGPYRLIFDLGSPVTLLSNKAAESSEAIDPNMRKSFLFGARGEGKVKTLEVGELTAEDVPVIVLDHPALKALGAVLGKPIDGIIGYTFFARYRTTLDYQKKELTFVPVDFQVRDLMKSLPAQMAAAKVAETRILAPDGFWGLTLDEPEGGVDSKGVPVAAVAPGSPAEIAGIKPGDVLTSLDGRWTTTIIDAYAAASSVSPATPTSVVILRDGDEVTLTVTPRDGI